MQPTGSTATPPQQDLLKTMQPPPQQLIMSTNKKKKYAQQSPPTQQQNQHQYQINKSFNTMSILKTSTNQQQQQTQSYSNVSNRALHGICSGNVAVNNCPINTAKSTTLFGLNQHGVVGGSGNTIVIDSNHITSSPVYGNTSIGGSAGGVNATVCNVGAPSNTGHGSGVVGMTIGTAAKSSSFTHENGIVGVNTSSVNVGGCIDNRKYDIQLKNNNKLLNNNSFQTPPEFAPSPGGSNGTGNIRQNQQATAIYRGPPTSTQPRSGTRNVQMQMYPQPMHQMMPYTQYGPRQPTYPGPQYSYSQTMPTTYYSSYQFYQPMQPQQHQRGPVGVNPGVGVNVGSAISVQPGPNGPSGAPHAQMPLAPGAVLTGPVPSGSSAVLGVTSPGPGQQQVGVGMSSMVGVPVPSAAPTQATQNKGARARPFALAIIDPDTQRPIVMDVKPKNVSNSELENQEVTSIPVTTPDVQMTSQQQHDLPMGVSSGRSMLQIEPDNRTTNIFNLDVHQMQRDVAGGQTPVVSAKSDAPSVEIRPTSQNPRHKKLISNAPPKDEHNKSQSFGKNAEEISKAHHQQKKTDETPVKLLNVQPLPQNSQVPHDSQLDPSQHSSIHTTQLELLDSTTSSTIAPQVTETNIQLPKDTSSGGCTNTTNQTTTDSQINANSYTYIFPDSNYPDTDPEQISQICNLGNSSSFTKSPTQTLTEVNTTILPEEVESLFQNMKLNEQETAVVETIPSNVFMDTDATATNGSGEDNLTQITVAVKEPPAPTPTPMPPSLTLPKAELSSPATLTGSVSMTEDKLHISDTIDSDKISSSDIDKDAAIVGDETDHKNIVHMSSETDTFKDPHLLSTGLEKTQIEPASSAASSTNGEIDSLSSTTNSDKTCCTAVSTTDIITTETTSNEFATETPLVTSSTAAAPSSTAAASALINYNEGQWSPQNPSGKKQYDREQLLQLREAKASRIQPEVSNVSIMSGSDNLMPSFARGNNSKGRGVQSMVGPIGGSRGGESNNYMSKQASMSGVNARNSTKGEKRLIHINLSLNQDVKLSETDNAWRPSVLGGSKDSEIDPAVRVQREKDELIRRVRGILNKLTPEKFDALVEEIIKLKIDSPDKVEDVMVLVFEKAIDEPNFSVSYARLCHRLVVEVKAQDERMESGTKTNLAAFRSALLDKTEREFTQNVTQRADREKKLQPIMDRIKASTDQTEKNELQALLEEEERKIRRRSGGTVRFIGELFKISMLTGKIIYHCIEKLLDPKYEDLLECLCKLLTTVGAKYEQTTTKDSKICYSLEKTIERMQSIASKSDKEGARVSSRVRFMLQDVIDLRTNKWQSSRNEGPKTMEQIDKEAKTEHMSSQYLNYGGMLSGSSGGNQNSGKRDDRLGGGRFNDNRSSGGYGGSHSQRGDTGSLRRQQQSGSSGNSGGGGNNISGGNNEDNTWHTIQTSKGSRSQAVDTNKLECLLNQNLDMGSKKMGGVHQFIWNSTQRQSTPTVTASNSFAALSSFVDTNKSINDRDRDRDRDRGGPRNKGSYNKGSMERDRYNERGIHSRTGSSQGSRENSSSRGNQSGRGMMMTMPSSMQKSASHKNYSQPMTPRMSGKPSGLASMSSASALHPHHRGDQTQQSSQQRSSESSNTSFPSTPPVAEFEEPSDDELKLMKSVVSEMIEIAASPKTISTAIVPCINRIQERQRCGLLYYILTDYLHLANVRQLNRRYIANIVVFLIKHKFISVDHFRLAYEQFCKFASDLIYDVPDLWLYIFEFTGPLITQQILTIKDLWIKELQDDESSNLGPKFLKTYLTYCTREIGVRFTRDMWKKFSMKWTDFMPESEVKNFIQTNKFEYVESEDDLPEIIVKDGKEKHINKVVDRVEHLLSEGSDHDAIIDYINGNIVDVDKQFIRSLTTSVFNFSINFKDESYKLDTESFVRVCIPVLHRYIDQKEERELECLYAMQFRVNTLEHPRGLLNDLFVELYENYVILGESFIKWRDSKDQSAGKGVAVKGLNQFFNQLISGETSEENN